jgi:hypothetical protein
MKPNARPIWIPLLSAEQLPQIGSEMTQSPRDVRVVLEKLPKGILRHHPPRKIITTGT